MSAQDKLTSDLIDIPGMGSPATTVNRAATGKRQVNFILSTEYQAVTIVRCKSRQDKQASQDLASNERGALETNEELEDRTESKQSINQSHILTRPVRVTHLPIHTHTNTLLPYPTTSSPCSITSKHPPPYLQDASCSIRWTRYLAACMMPRPAISTDCVILRRSPRILFEGKV